MVLKLAIPKSITKVSKDGNVTFTSNINVFEYALDELIRGALRDVGKFVAKKYRLRFYQKQSKQSGQVGKGTGYWVRKRELDLQVGIAKKGVGYWGGFFEVGSAENGIPKQNNLRNVVIENLNEIRTIESKYLKYLNADRPMLNGLSEEDYEG